MARMSVELKLNRLLNRKSEMDNVAVLDDVLFPFEAKLSCLLALGFASKGDEILIGNHLGADEAALDVTVDFSRSFPSVGSLRDRPCADFVFARGQKTDQIQKGVGRMDKPVSRRLFDADFFQERLAVALFELCDFHFHLAGQGQTFRSEERRVGKECRSCCWRTY